MHSVIKDRQWGERRPSGRLVALVLGVAMSGLLGQAAGVHSQSIVGPGGSPARGEYSRRRPPHRAQTAGGARVRSWSRRGY
jgi:hypothetical protein